MYFESIELENVGPIDYLHVHFPQPEGLPKPILLVGENGSGKSILLAHLVNSLILARQHIFEDAEVVKGKVYKYRSPMYIKSGQDYFYSCTHYTQNLSVTEWQLRLSKHDFEDQLKYTPSRPSWAAIPTDGSSHFDETLRHNLPATRSLVKDQCLLYFPPNRFEEPAWLNRDNLTAVATYTDLRHITGYSNRNIICASPLKANINWLLDVIFDRQAFEMQTAPIPVPGNGAPPGTTVNVFLGYHGRSTAIYEAIIRVLNVILRPQGTIRLGAGNRKQRMISVLKDEQQWIPNLFQLSTGETQLLNLFLSILRDYDLSDGPPSDIADIPGIVIIDEIDAHLHAVHQKEVLPKLIALFPKIQFVVTTHSPLFLMGMNERFGDKAFDILDMPTGTQIAPSDFDEFVAAYNAFKETERHREELRLELARASKPIVFVEGASDLKYIQTAAELLGEHELISQLRLEEATGYGNLDKMWRSYNNAVSAVLPGKILLLYDCDTNKDAAVNNRIYKRVLPFLQEAPLSSGIENLFPRKTIEFIEDTHPEFIDNTPPVTKRVRGQDVCDPGRKEVNQDEKSHMCNWLCETGDETDFVHFTVVFEILREFIST